MLVISEIGRKADIKRRSETLKGDLGVSAPSTLEDKLKRQLSPWG